jgi:anaerobic selenocysteine-containing dehydrogenase
VHDQFVLISRRRRLGHNSWMHGGVRDGDPERAAWMAHDDLVALGVAPGDTVAIRTDAGSLVIAAQSHESVPRGVVVVPHGVAGTNVNAVIPSGAGAIEPASGQHRMTGIAVRVERG